MNWLSQGKYRDLFVSLNMEKWLSVLPACRSVEVQTDITDVPQITKAPVHYLIHYPVFLL